MPQSFFIKPQWVTSFGHFDSIADIGIYVMVREKQRKMSISNESDASNAKCPSRRWWHCGHMPSTERDHECWKVVVRIIIHILQEFDNVRATIDLYVIIKEMECVRSISGYMISNIPRSNAPAFLYNTRYMLLYDYPDISGCGKNNNGVVKL